MPAADCTRMSENASRVLETATWIRKQWQQLKLETLRKRELNDADIRALAQYACSYNPVYGYFQHTGAMRRGLPLAVADFTEQTATQLMGEAAGLKGIRHLQTNGRYADAKDPVANLAVAIDRDLARIMNCFRAGAESVCQGRSEQELGLWESKRNGKWHSDSTAPGADGVTEDQKSDGGLALVGRIELPPEFMDEDKRVFRAEDRAVYVMATRYTTETGHIEPGNVHRSAEIPVPTRSFFARLIVPSQSRV